MCKEKTYCVLRKGAFWWCALALFTVGPIATICMRIWWFRRLAAMSGHIMSWFYSAWLHQRTKGEQNKYIKHDITLNSKGLMSFDNIYTIYTNCTTFAGLLAYFLTVRSWIPFNIFENLAYSACVSVEYYRMASLCCFGWIYKYTKYFVYANVGKWIWFNFPDLVVFISLLQGNRTKITR